MVFIYILNKLIVPVKKQHIGIATIAVIYC